MHRITLLSKVSLYKYGSITVFITNRYLAIGRRVDYFILNSSEFYPGEVSMINS